MYLTQSAAARRVPKAPKDELLTRQPLPNGTGSEVMLVLFRQPEMDDAEFARDAGLMQKDLLTLKRLLERQ